LAVLVGEEAIIVGDIVLPDISPWPTRQALFSEIAEDPNNALSSGFN